MRWLLSLALAAFFSAASIARQDASVAASEASVAWPKPQQQEMHDEAVRGTIDAEAMMRNIYFTGAG